MSEPALLEQLRTVLPQLLREYPEVRHEVWGLMLEAFPSRQEFMQLLEELRASREDSNRRFEAMDRRFEELRADMNQRFEAVDRRFEAVDRRFEELRTDMNQRFEAVDRRFEAVDRRFEELRTDMNQRFEAVLVEQRDQGRRLREVTLHMSSLGGRVGHGLEQVVKEMVEEFAGQAFPAADRLVLQDEQGEVFGVPGAEVEFDLYARNGTAYLVEVKSHLKTSDVLLFHRKVQFAQAKLGRAVIPLVIALSMHPRAEQRMRELGVRYRVGAGGAAEDIETREA